jgi:hypothetical protein
MTSETDSISLAKAAKILRWSGAHPERRLRRYIEGRESELKVEVLKHSGRNTYVTLGVLRRECPELFPGTTATNNMRVAVRTEVERYIAEIVHPRIEHLAEEHARLKSFVLKALDKIGLRFGK